MYVSLEDAMVRYTNTLRHMALGGGDGRVNLHLMHHSITYNGLIATSMRLDHKAFKGALERMEYHHSVGDSLIKLRVSGERGKFAVLCDKKFLTADWLRTIPRIMERADSCVQVRQF